MKTVMKKLLSVMLVALLLVSAVPFAASAAEAVVGYKVELKIYVNEVYKETITEAAFSEAELDAWAAFPVEELAAELGLSYYNPETDSVKGFANTRAEGATTLVYNIWIETAPVEAPEEEEKEDEKDDKPLDAPGAVEVEKYVLTVNTGSGSYTVKVVYGDKYLDVLAAPARPDREFKGWKSEVLGGMIKSEDYIESDDTVTAVWGDVNTYTLTLDENRNEDEIITYGVKVAYGEEIFAKVNKYQPEREGYVFMGWKLNGKMIDKKTVYELQGDATAYAVWKLESDTEDEPMNGGTNVADGKVYLEIYVNGDTSAAEAKVDITKYADDNKITQAEVEKVVKGKITPKSGYKLAYEGLFDEESWWWYVRDPETNGKASIIVNRDGDDYIYVMVKNVKVVAADPSNPKTGDGIVVALATMMSTGGAALALGKKKFF